MIWFPDHLRTLSSLVKVEFAHGGCRMRSCQVAAIGSAWGGEKVSDASEVCGSLGCIEFLFNLSFYSNFILLFSSTWHFGQLARQTRMSAW